jgi:hypothetical protein
MKIIKAKDGSFTISGLTLGKLIAIESQLRLSHGNGTLTPVAHDVMSAISHTLQSEMSKP